MSSAFPDFSRARLVVHIASHYVAARTVYLRRVLDEINTYTFQKIDVFIDTNSHELASLLEEYAARPGMQVQAVIHHNLEHPFDLTWTHRDNIQASLDDYDYFMYLEDDMCVSAAALEAWRKDSEQLAPLGYLRGFIRVETNRHGELVSTDYKQRVAGRRVLRLGKRLYLRPRNPHQGFWIYSRQQMQTFINSECWRSGNVDWPPRERAAAGMIWLDPENHNIVVPLDHDTIAEEAIVLHLPNNYADDPSTRFGKLRLRDILRQTPWDRLYRRWLHRKTAQH